MIKTFKDGSKKIFTRLGLISLEIILLIVVFCGALFGFISIAEKIFSNNKTNFDITVFNFLSMHVSNSNTSLMQLFTFLGAHKFLIPANLILIAYFIIKKHRWYSIKIPVVALSSVLLMFFLKMIFHRDRPMSPLLAGAMGFSFPSGHALMSTTFYGLLIFIVFESIKNKVLKWTLIMALSLLVLFIGISRVYLRVHYASDVIAGFCVGVTWLLLSIWVLGKIENYNKEKSQPVSALN
jgi:undecaprenyl-diphosphatase